MKHIAIFGAKGYLGKQLTFYFNQKGVTSDGYDVPECDITCETVWKTFEPTKYDAILFFAGLTGTEKGFNEAIKYTTVNEIGLQHLLMNLSPLGEKAPRIVFPSTRLVYKGSEHPIKEDAPKETKTVYAVNKLACEGYLDAYSNRFGIPFIVPRICVPFGSLITSEYSYGTIGFFIKQALAGGPITLYGDGSVRRTFTHVADICNIIYRLMKSDAVGTFNIGGMNYSLKDVASKVADKYNVAIAFQEWPMAAQLIESGSTVFDSRKLEGVIGKTDYGDILL